MRPRTFDEYLGQDHLVGPNKLLRRLIEAGQLPSLILWGPPGSGKTTLARIIAAQTKAHFVAISAVSAGVADLRRVIAEAQARRAQADASRGSGGAAHAGGARGVSPRSSLITEAEQTDRDAQPNASASQKTILFIDEIHRFNKAQQDAVLPYVEDGTVTLIGATTENPSFEVIGPLLSRSRVFTLKALTEPDLEALIRRAVTDPDRGLGHLNLTIDDDAIAALAASVGGDARIALNALEAAAFSVPAEPTRTVRPDAPDGGVGPALTEGQPDSEMLSSPSPSSEGGLGGEVSPPSSPDASRGSGGAAHAGGARGVSPRNSSLINKAEQTAPGDVGEDAGAGRTSLSNQSAQPTPGPAGQRRITRAIIEEALQHRTYLYDRQGDSHYDTISAFIKSLRGSDPDGALYWLARMIEAGEDPLFIVRRMIILAAEDVGLDDPQALGVATACQQAVHFIGMPEGFLPMAETALYLALAPKSNTALTAYRRALADVEATRNDPVPLHLRNAVTGLMHQQGYGRGYMYAHDYEGGVAPGQTYLPDRLKGHRYYIPRNLGHEKDLSTPDEVEPDSTSPRS
jgi:putative ATPase